jgi:hypothetical protein
MRPIVHPFAKVDPRLDPKLARAATQCSRHVEIRTKDEFVSDYHSKYRCFYPLNALYGKFGS